MGYLDRYIRGEHEQVWSELQSLGEAVRQEPLYGEARQVADETLRRVARNCDRIVTRLRSLGYAFGVYPDGSHGYFSLGPLVPPTDATHTDQAILEKNVGPLPLSLAAFWGQVGSVDLVGMHPSWPRALDPLVVRPPEAGVSELAEMDEMLDSLGHFEASLAPDTLHKDNISGGAPYAVKLPDSAMDFRLLNERHELHFVPYLRMAILRCGGFPGIEGREEELDLLGSLAQGLEPF